MILGYSELPPLSLVAEPPKVHFPSYDVVRVFFGYKLYLDPSICRALAQRGERLNSDCGGGYDLREEFYGEWHCMDCGAKSPADCIYSK